MYNNVKIYNNFSKNLFPDEKSGWLNNAMATLEKTPKTTNPTVLNCQFYSEKDAFETVCRPILNKSKPKVEPPPKEEEKKNSTASGDENSKKASKEGDETMEEVPVNGTGNGSEQQQQTMDLD